MSIVLRFPSDSTLQKRWFLYIKTIHSQRTSVQKSRKLSYWRSRCFISFCVKSSCDESVMMHLDLKLHALYNYSCPSWLERTFINLRHLGNNSLEAAVLKVAAAVCIVWLKRRLAEHRNMEKPSAVRGGGGGAVHVKNGERRTTWMRKWCEYCSSCLICEKKCIFCIFLCLCHSRGEFTILVLQTCCCVDDHQTAELWFSAAVCTLSGGAIHMGLLRMLMISPAAGVDS